MSVHQFYSQLANCQRLVPKIGFAVQRNTLCPTSSGHNHICAFARQAARSFCHQRPVKAQTNDFQFNPLFKSHVDSCFREFGESASRARHGFRFSESTTKAESGAGHDSGFLFSHQHGTAIDKMFHNAHTMASYNCQQMRKAFMSTRKRASGRGADTKQSNIPGVPFGVRWRTRHNRCYGMPSHHRGRETVSFSKTMLVRLQNFRPERGNCATWKNTDQLNTANYKDDSITDAAQALLPAQTTGFCKRVRASWETMSQSRKCDDLGPPQFSHRSGPPEATDKDGTQADFSPESASDDISHGHDRDAGEKDFIWTCPLMATVSKYSHGINPHQRETEGRDESSDAQGKFGQRHERCVKLNMRSDGTKCQHKMKHRHISPLENYWHIAPAAKNLRRLTQRAYHTASCRSGRHAQMTDSIFDVAPIASYSIQFKGFTSFAYTEWRSFFSACTAALNSLVRVSMTAIPVLWRWNLFSRFPWLATMAWALPVTSMAVILILTCEEHPLTGRARFMLVNETQELQEAQSSYGQLLVKHKESFLPINHPQFMAVNSVLQPLLAIVGPLRDWELHVVADDSCKDAFITPSGKIFIFTGMLELAGSKAGIAAIIAHEIAHVLSRHGAEKFGANSLMDLGAIFLHSCLYTLSVNLPVVTDLVGRIMASTKIGLGKTAYSRLCESEADLVGMYLMSLAGYNPVEAITFWNRMSIVDKNQEDHGLLSSHPSHSQRAQQLEPYLLQAQDMFEQRKELAHKFMDTRKQWRRAMRSDSHKTMSVSTSRPSLDEFNSMLSFILAPHLKM